VSQQTKVQKKANGQYVTTIPKALAETMRLDGETVEWQVESRDRLSITATRESNE
jgi:antitoxin component of MazEF toxin-antitoxin module